LSTIKKRYESTRKELSENNESCIKYNNIPWKALRPVSIAYVFIMGDDALFEYITQCVSAGYATQKEISGMFNLRQHVMDSRITIANSEKLRIYWNQLVQSMAETFPPANPTFLNATKTNEKGEIVDCGLVSAVRKFASRGDSKQEICRMMQFNPSSWNELPILLQAYEQGMVEFLSGKSEKNLDAITTNFIANDFFIEVVIPAIKLEAFDHIVTLVKKKYSIKQVIDEEGKPTGEETKILKSEDHEEKLIPGNKEMRDLAFRLSSGNLLNQISIDTNKKREALKAIPMHTSSKMTKRGTFEQSVEDIACEPVK